MTTHDVAFTSQTCVSFTGDEALRPVEVIVGVYETATSTVPAAFSAILCTAKSGNWMPVRNLSHAAKPSRPEYTT